ncbi:MAG TPA: HhoA/HhoB/HtrA family serine endopeptidase [Waterburya sp.]|jgi:Do/DeqQ family serine protease
MVLDTQSPKPQNAAPAQFRKAVTYLSLVLLGAGVSFSSSYFLSGNLLSKGTPDSQNSSKVLAQTPPATAPVLIQDPNFIANVVEKVGPAVVRIDSSRTVTSQVPEIFNNPFFRDFFGADIPTGPQQRVERGTGSGFIISRDGEILTNAHVVDGADTVNVTLKDGRSFAGKVIGTDPVTDVAIVKIQANSLPTVTLGDSEQLKPGEWAIAIGNPLGLDNTVTKGIISATGRSSSQVGVPDKRVQFIQTDAAINPGNSGGPLLNASGQVIGMNTAIIQGAQGLGFAIPINTAKRIANQLIAKGRVQHPYLGIQMVTLTPELKQNINSNPNAGLTVDEDNGILIAKVLPNSPAARSGLRAGDVIHKINGQSVKNAEDIQKAVEDSQVGSNLQIELRRNQREMNVTVKPSDFPIEQAQRQ